MMLIYMIMKHKSDSVLTVVSEGIHNQHVKRHQDAAFVLTCIRQ